MSQLINFLDFVNEQLTPEQVPSHEELSRGKWFGHFKHLLEAFHYAVQWSTGAKAYANGTRTLTVSRGRIRFHDLTQTYRFYPLKSIVYLNESSLLRDIKLVDLSDWDAAFEKMWVQRVSQELAISRHRRVREAVENGDLPQFNQWIEAANRQRKAIGSAPLPADFIAIVSEPFLSPEESEALAYLRSVGMF